MGPGRIERGEVPRRVARGWVTLALAVWGGQAPPAWHSDAACRDHDPRYWDENTATARKICAACPVKGPCSEAAQRARGTTPQQYVEDIYGVHNGRKKR
ncbi:WhiB family transcriptional regulator [Saccharopolyspora elongata]|uniref:4Fe-4S Wbl-type domain-containing protein n=1 Tax=Saccharopolyspora elongata TaxID=2530387 RepID=A0A4R4Y191_9PSEU|nr:hypothetical protein E1288_39910 [Saccharopolyspora elongata]